MTRRGVLMAGACGLVRGGGTVRVVVAQDGSGDFSTVQRAVDHVLDGGPAAGRVVIEVRPGVYKERVKIQQDKARFSLIGSGGAERTVITASVSAGAVGGTFFSPVVEVNGAEFEAEGITFENTHGTGSQAVAVSVFSDKARFSKCRFLGWQDTLYAAWGRQYYRKCRIEGHVDFIFGNAAAVFDVCEIYSRGTGYITAHSRTADAEPTGFVFRRCRLTGTPGLLREAGTQGEAVPFPESNSGKGVSLGRPWRARARVAFLDCWMGEHVRPVGWDNWGKAENEATAWFGEAGSSGPGARGPRAAWARRVTAREAAALAPAVFLKGRDGWRAE